MKRILLLSALMGMALFVYSQSVPFPTTYREYEDVSPWGYNQVGTNWDTSPYLPFIYQDKWFRILPPNGVTYNSSTKTWTNANPSQKYPLILFFHGAGERGTDNNNQLKYLQGHKTAVLNGTFPGFVLAPQNVAADGAKTLIDKLIATMPIDPNRIYVHGYSNGAVWSWDFAIKFPTRVAALFPMSGVDERAKTTTLLYTPIRLAQGELDTNPAPNWTQTIVDWYTTNGGNMQYFYMPGVGHGTWTTQYNKADFYSWFLSKKKNNPLALFAKTQTCPGDPINIKLGLTPGFSGYEWRKDGTLISGANQATLTVTSFGIYTARINNGGTWSDWSDPINVSLKPPTATPAIQVSGLKSSVLPAPDGSTTTSLQLPEGYQTYTWKNATTNAVLSNERILADVPVGSYKAAVLETNGCSSNDSPIFNVVNANGPQGPDAISGFIGYATTQTDISLSWVDNPTPQYNETGFEIYRATASGGPFKLIAIRAANTDDYTDSNLTPNTNYYYLVRPVNQNAAGAVSETIMVKTQVDAIAPTAPTNLTITSISGNAIALSWTASTDNVGVYRYDVFKNGERVLAVNTTSTTVYNLTEDEIYTFSVKARDVTGNYSASSNQVTTAAAGGGLNYKYYETATLTALPDFNTLTPVAETGNTPNVDISVRNRTTNYAFYWEGQIYIPAAGSYTFETYSDDGSKLYIGGYNELNLVVNNDGNHATQYREGTRIFAAAGMYPIVITYYHASSTATMQVYWKNTPIGITSRAQIPNWAFQEKVVIPGTAPTAPRNVAVTAAAYNQVNVSWTDQSNNEQGFQIFRSTTNAGPFIPVGDVGPGVTTFADKSVQPNTTYYYRVEAFGQYGQSGPSDEILHGLKYAFYEQTVTSVNQLAYFTPAKTGIITNFDMGPRTKTTNYGFSWEGKIKIPTTGSWTFYTTSDDASILYIDGVQRITTDASPTTSERSAVISGLTAGQHTIKVLYRQGTGSSKMEVRYSGPGVSRTLIPATALADTEPNATTPALPPVPTAPTNLVATATSANAIALTWNDNSSDEANFQLYRSAGDAASFILYKTLPANTTSFSDADLFANYTFYYKVVAINAGGTTTSNVVNTTTLDNAPVITPIADVTMKFATESNIDILAEDVDHEPMTLSVVGLPAFGIFSDYGDGSGLLKFTPSQAQLGNYPISVIVTDQHNGKDTTSFVLIVTDKNPPALQPINSVSVNENGTGSVVVSATSDLGAGNLTWTTTGLPAFATLNVSNGMGTISFAPGFTDSGVYPITVKIKDSQNNEATRSFTLTVTDVNPNTAYYVDLVNSGTATAPWNGMTGLTLSGLTDDKGAASSVGVSFQTTTWASYNEGAVTGNNTGVFPDAVIRDYYYFGIFGNPNTVDVNVTGLDPAKQYTFKFMASSKWTGVTDNGTTVYTINGTSASVNAQNNSQNLAVINNVTPNASGVVTFTMSKASGTQVGYLNAFVVENVYQNGTAPAAPRSVAAVITTDAKVKVTWVDAPFNETGFDVYRSTTENGTYTKLNATAVAANGTEYVDGTISDGITYYYKVSAVNSYGTSPYSNVASIAIPNLAPKITVTGNLVIAPGAQSSLSVTALDPPTNAVTITVTGLPSFATYQSLTATTGSIIMNPTATDDGEYTFTVKATDADGAASTQDVTIEIGEVPLYKIFVNFSQTSNAPAPWNNTSKVPAANDVFANLKDDSNVNRNVSLTLQTAFGGVFNESPQTGDNSGVVPDAVLKEYYWFGIFSSPNQINMKLSGLSKSNKYNFKFIASSNFSNNGAITENGSTVFTINGKTASVKVQNNTSKLGLIDGIVTNAAGEITIAVTKGADAPAGYVNGFIVEAVPLDPATFVPGNLTAAGTANQIVLNWTDNSPEETGFQIYRSTTGAAGSFTLLATTAADVQTYTDATVAGTQLYYYQVRATLASGSTAFSNTASAGVVRFRVYVNLNGAATYDAPAPWNNTSRFGLTNDIFYGFKDENGKSTGLQMRVQHELENANDWGMTTGNNSGIFPDKVLQSFWFNDAYFPVGEFAVEGLDQTFNYNFGFLGSIDVTTAVSTQYSIGDQVTTNVNNKNTSNVSYIRAVVPSGNSDVLITVKEAAGSPWSIWNAMIIEGYPTGRKASNGRSATAMSTGNMREVRYGEANPQIAVYPNPLTGSTLNIESKDSSIGDVRYEVADVMGKPVLSGTIKNESIDAAFSVDFGKQTLSSGVYVLKLKYPDGRTLTKKFVKD